MGCYIVQHTWSTSYVPPHMQHLSGVIMEHMNLPRLYPHTRVTGYEPPCLYHHVFTTIHELTHSWHNISWTKSASLIITTHAYQILVALTLVAT